MTLETIFQAAVPSLVVSVVMLVITRSCRNSPSSYSEPVSAFFSRAPKLSDVLVMVLTSLR